VTAAPEISVLAASSLAGVFKTLQREFEATHPGIRVSYSFAGSTLLRSQIEQGAPADVFASADREQMELLQQKQKVMAPVVLARNRLALVVPARNPGRILVPSDLAKPGLRVVSTEPSVPIGRYTRQLLERLSRQSGYPPDFVSRVEANVVSREANVREVLTRVELGEADAGFVYTTDVRGSRRLREISLPSGSSPTAEYMIAVVGGAPNRIGAGAFVKYAISPRARTVLRQFGFLD
jgi:molybdate transport system substrate-binding protein